MQGNQEEEDGSEGELVEESEDSDLMWNTNILKLLNKGSK